MAFIFYFCVYFFYSNMRCIIKKISEDVRGVFNYFFWYLYKLYYYSRVEVNLKEDLGVKNYLIKDEICF